MTCAGSSLVKHETEAPLQADRERKDEDLHFRKAGLCVMNGKFAATLICISLVSSCSRNAALRVADGSVSDHGAAAQPDAEECCSAIFDGAFSWTGSMTVARIGHAASLLGDGRVLIVGGDDVRNASLQVGSAELYDSASGTFTAAGNLLNVRAYSTATLIGNNRVLVAGGMANISVGGTSDAQAELYDPSTGIFSATGSLTAGQRVYHTATALLDGNVLIAGGLPLVSLAPADPHADVYDVRTGSFSATGNMMVARFQHTATLLVDGRVLIAGGKGDGGLNASAELFNPSTRVFASTGSMMVARYSHTATILEDGRVLVAGGADNDGKALGSAELYDPTTGSFTGTGGLVANRYGHSATLLCDGTVLVVGGSDGLGNVLASTEFYDPRTGTFRAIAVLLGSGRSGHTAARLCSGKVLIAGGVDASTSNLSTAELYE